MAGTYFNQAAVLAGLYTAMDFGAPNTATDRATFYMPRTVSSSGNQDSDGVPFNPSNGRVFGSLVKKTVPCAVEYIGGTGKDENFGVLNPDKVKLTILGPDFLNIQGFEYVVISGNKYLYVKAEPVIALGSIDVHQIYCRAEDVY